MLPQSDKQVFRDMSKKEFLEQRKASTYYHQGRNLSLQPPRAKVNDAADADADAASDASQGDSHLTKARTRILDEGTRFGNYVLKDDTPALGEGAYGVVLKARDVTTYQSVALKIFNGARGVDSAKVEFAVYKAIKALRHPVTGHCFFFFRKDGHYPASPPA